jgi:hypothetical protein
MDHVWYILGAYAVGVLVPLGLAVGASVRLAYAKARLGALGPRQARTGGGGEQS